MENGAHVIWLHLGGPSSSSEGYPSPECLRLFPFRAQDLGREGAATLSPDKRMADHAASVVLRGQKVIFPSVEAELGVPYGPIL